MKIKNMDLANKKDYDLTELKRQINQPNRNILILTHRNPDGDALGSSLALFNVLKQMKHQVDIILPNAFPNFLAWMPGAKHIINYSRNESKALECIQRAEIIIAVDFNDLNRVSEFKEPVLKSRAYKVLIDHHPDPESFADLIISKVHTSSASEIIYSLLKELKLNHLITMDVVTCVYTGIMTDTGCFSFNSSLSETFNTVAELLECNIDKDQIYSNVYDNFSFERMKLMGYCLDQKMRYFPEFKTGIITLSQEEMSRYHFKVGDSEGFVNMPLSIKGICFSVLFTENKDMIRISFRSKGNFNVNRFASQYFNGGGHKNAAGGESYDSLDKTVERFIQLLPAHKNELCNE